MKSIRNTFALLAIILAGLSITQAQPAEVRALSAN